jgi:hypothetical protein
MEANVIAALSSVIDEMPPIGRDGRASQQQGGYAYRGIEQITRAAAPLLAKHGVVFVPQVVGMETRELTVNSKPWTDTILTVRYRVCGPGGPEDFVEATVVGIGRDNSDKGANKALTQAFKYALTQVLCIGDSRDDVDGDTHEADEPPAHASKEAIDALIARIEALDPETAESFKAWKNDQGFPWPWPVPAMIAMHAELDKIASAPGAEGVDPAPAPDPPGEPHGYEKWSKEELAGEAKSREIPHSGSKDRLVSELRAWDALYDPDGVEYDTPQF